MKGTAEFETLQSYFEKTIKDIPVYIGFNEKSAREERTPRVSKTKRDFYNNGTLNSYFLIYMHGYAFSKSINI